MIDPKELRIGNLVDTINRSGQVHLPNDRSKMIGQVGLFGVHLYEIDKPFACQLLPPYTDTADLCPIPLTEEWLLRFGFETADCEIDFMEYTKDYEKDSHVYSLCNRGGFDGHAENPFYVTISEGQKNGWSHDHDIEIKHVHQLQNFHFALTGQELTIKTPVEV